MWPEDNKKPHMPKEVYYKPQTVMYKPISDEPIVGEGIIDVRPPEKLIADSIRELRGQIDRQFVDVQTMVSNGIVQSDRAFSLVSNLAAAHVLTQDMITQLTKEVSEVKEALRDLIYELQD